MKTYNYFELKFAFKGDLEVLTHYLFSQGASGVEEDLDFFQKPGCPEVELQPHNQRQVKAYFYEKPLLADLSQFVSSYELKEKKSEDWTLEFKKSWPPIELGEGYWVVPSWETSPVESTKTLSIDPGMAFGTGTHETTQIMCQFLLENKKLLDSDKKVLDVGTGSGVLSILAYRLGAGELAATELDEQSQRVAQENFQRNNVPVQFLNSDLSSQTEGYDVVLANILEFVLLDLQPDLLRLCKSDLFVSGILKENLESFKNKFLNPKMNVLQEIKRGEWVGLWIRV